MRKQLGKLTISQSRDENTVRRVEEPVIEKKTDNLDAGQGPRRLENISPGDDPQEKFQRFRPTVSKTKSDKERQNEVLSEPSSSCGLKLRVRLKPKEAKGSDRHGDDEYVPSTERFPLNLPYGRNRNMEICQIAPVNAMKE